MPREPKVPTFPYCPFGWEERSVLGERGGGSFIHHKSGIKFPDKWEIVTRQRVGTGDSGAMEGKSPSMNPRLVKRRCHKPLRSPNSIHPSSVNEEIVNPLGENFNCRWGDHKPADGISKFPAWFNMGNRKNGANRDKGTSFG